MKFTMFCVSSLLLVSSIAFGQGRNYQALDEHFRNLRHVRSIDQVVAEVNSYARDDWEKTRAVFIWITDNIAYDMESYLTKIHKSYAAKDVFATKKTACTGYSWLFFSIGTRCGLKVEIISGYTRLLNHPGNQNGSSLYTEGHNWNAVMIDGRWHLFDPTKGSGYSKGREFDKCFNGLWFDTMPELFRYVQIPSNEKWQLMDTPITLQDFNKMKFVSSSTLDNLSRMGVSQESMVEVLRRSDIVESLSFRDRSVTLLEAPLVKTLNSTDEYIFRFRVYGIERAAIINNGDWYHMTPVDGIFSTRIRLKNGTAKVALGITGVTYQTILKYEIK